MDGACEVAACFFGQTLLAFPTQEARLLLTSEDEHSELNLPDACTTPGPPRYHYRTSSASSPLVGWGLERPPSPCLELASPATVSSERLAIKRETRADVLRSKCLRLIVEREEAVAQRFAEASLVLEQSLEIDRLGEEEERLLGGARDAHRLDCRDFG